MIEPRQAINGPELRPLLCVGGPAHGRLMDNPLHDCMKVPIWGGPLSSEFGVDFYEDPTMQQRVVAALYERDKVALMLGRSAYFEAVVWRWHLMNREEAAVAALGLLFASAMKNGAPNV